MRGGGQRSKRRPVSPRSDVIGRTLAELDFRRRFRATVIALARNGELVILEIGEARLRAGHLLLMVALADEVGGLATRPGLLVVSGAAISEAGPARSPWLAAAILAATIVSAGLVADAYLAALAVEHGCEFATIDGDFGRFSPPLRLHRPFD